MQKENELDRWIDKWSKSSLDSDIGSDSASRALEELESLIDTYVGD